VERAAAAPARAGGARVKVGFHFADFTYGVAPVELGATLDAISDWVDAAGFDRLSVMDHYFQIAALGPPERER